MGAKTGISWCDSTRIIDRSGRRIRMYVKKNPARPGTQMRRIKRAEGLSWCRGCRAWLPSGQVSGKGICREHANAEHRALYRSNPAMRAKYHSKNTARKRSVAFLPPLIRELVFERFEGLCAYCSEPADTLDHVIPVKLSGESARGNLLPACRSCNCRKRTKTIEEFLELCEREGKLISDQILDELCMEYV